MKIEDKINIWKNKPFDKETIYKITELEKNEEELNERFHSDLEFGTGGIRGLMGVGTNRINKYTISKFTQGIANYLNNTLEKDNKTIIIAYDNRRNSKFFSDEVAKVFSANNFNVLIFDDVRPTPLLSFSIRHFNADSGIMITASHNPPEYNGYKVYNSFGGQIVPPDDKKISDSIKKLSFKVLVGKDKNKTGEIIELDRKRNRAKIKGITMIKKHLKTTKERKGGIVDKENFVHLSNLKLDQKKDKKKAVKK